MTSDELNLEWKASAVMGWTPSNPNDLRESVATLYESQREEVFRYLRSLGVSPQEARDICQEAFFRLYLALQRGERIRNLRAWVFTVAHNCRINEVRARHDEPIDQDLGRMLRDTPRSGGRAVAAGAYAAAASCGDATGAAAAALCEFAGGGISLSGNRRDHGSHD
jgi:DNA-directed RNA polymerase specialized sigma24 family protein